MLKNILSDLVKFQTVSRDHAENRRALLWVARQLKGLPVIVRRFNINGFPSLLVTTRKTLSPKLLLQGHIDVVDGSTQVFKPKIVGKKLYGRGVFDMKYATACYIKLFQDWGPKLKFLDLGILLTTDEELGGANGAGALIKLGIKPQVCFLPDGGEDWNVQRSAKGIFQIKVISRGKSGHSSRPWSGVNALDSLIDYLQATKKQFRQEPCGDKAHRHPTMTISKITGGQMINQIPDYAEADVDIRFTPKLKLTDLRRIVRKHLRAGLTIQELNFANAYQVDMKNPHVARFLTLLKKRGFNPKYVDSHGSSDARYFVDQKIPTIILRPVGGGHHTEQEWISLPDLEVFYDLLKEFVLANASRE